MVRSLDERPHPADELPDVLRYLSAGPDAGALRVLAAEPPTMKGYLYVLHEVIEIGALREYLDAPRPQAGFKRGGTNVARPTGDLWAFNFHNNRTLTEAVHPADHEARRIESQVEKALIRLLFGKTIPLAALVWTIETKPGAASGWEDETVRTKVAALLGNLGPPSADEADDAREYRQRLWDLRLEDVVARAGSMPELPFGLWQSRECPPHDDQRDWFAADDFNRMAREV
jgi:hypothetical protein